MSKPQRSVPDAERILGNWFMKNKPLRHAMRKILNKDRDTLWEYRMQPANVAKLLLASMTDSDYVLCVDELFFDSSIVHMHWRMVHAAKLIQLPEGERISYLRNILLEKASELDEVDMFLAEDEDEVERREYFSMRIDVKALAKAALERGDIFFTLEEVEKWLPLAHRFQGEQLQSALYDHASTTVGTGAVHAILKALDPSYETRPVTRSFAGHCYQEDEDGDDAMEEDYIQSPLSPLAEEEDGLFGPSAFDDGCGMETDVPEAARFGACASVCLTVPAAAEKPVMVPLEEPFNFFAPVDKCRVLPPLDEGDMMPELFGDLDDGDMAFFD